METTRLELSTMEAVGPFLLLALFFVLIIYLIGIGIRYICPTIFLLTMLAAVIVCVVAISKDKRE